jgi:hypothetical protein
MRDNSSSDSLRKLIRHGLQEVLAIFKDVSIPV